MKTQKSSLKTQKSRFLEIAFFPKKTVGISQYEVLMIYRMAKSGKVSEDFIFKIRKKSYGHR